MTAAPLLVLIHGAGHDHRVWQAQSAALQQAGLDVLALDLPGHGQTPGPALAPIEALADWVLAQLPPERPLLLAGHSMGSLIALEAAARAPARCVGLALLGTVFPMRVAPALLEMARKDPDQTHRMINQWSFTLAHQAETDLCERNRQLLAAQPPASLPVDLAACNSYQGGLEAARQIRCPVLLLCAEQDKMTPLKALPPLQDALASAPRIEQQILPDSGHSMMSEAPEAVSAALLAFAQPFIQASSSPLPAPSTRQ